MTYISHATCTVHWLSERYYGVTLMLASTCFIAHETQRIGEGIQESSLLVNTNGTENLARKPMISLAFDGLHMRATLDINVVFLTMSYVCNVM